MDHRRPPAVQRMSLVVIAAARQTGDVESAAIDIAHIPPGRIVVVDASTDVVGRFVVHEILIHEQAWSGRGPVRPWVSRPAAAVEIIARNRAAC